jgi:opacity protein-like surface antigen
MADMGIGGRASVIFLVLAALLGVAPAAAEAAQNCTLTRNGDVYCSGGAQPVRVRVNGKVVQLAASGDSTCALTEPGEVYCWPADQAGADQAGAGRADAGQAGADQAAADQAAVDQAAAESSEDDGGLGVNPLLLISIGLALVGGGFALVKVGGGQGARPRAESRNASAPALSLSE